jgi:Flp pilus assembly protein TadD
MTNLLKKPLLLVVVACAQIATAQTHADGMAAMQLEEWDKAIGIFTKLSQTDPTDQNALLTLGNAYLAKSEKDKALDAFKAAFSAKPEGSMAFTANGRILLLQNNAAEADKQFAKAAKNAKKDMVAQRQIGESYFFYIEPGGKRPNLTRAEALLKAAVEVNGKDFGTLMSLGYCYKEMSNGGLAAQNYEYAEALDPKNPLPKLMLAKVYKAAKLPEKALTFFDKSIAASSSYTPALRGKAEHLYFARKWEAATQAYKDLVANGAEVKIEDEMQLANCLFITKDCKGCSELVEKILKKDPSKNYLRRLQAYCDFDNGEYARGLNILDEYFKIVTPDKVLATDYEYHAKLLVVTKGDTTRAIEDYRQAISMDSSKWPTYETISNLEYARKNYCASATALRTYLDSVPAPKATDWYNLGTRYYYCKDDPMRYEKAEQAFIKVTEMNPKAGIGWLWAGKAASKRDPLPDSIAVHPELANQYGVARPFYEKYVEIAEVDKEKNKKDLLPTYNYLSYCYFVRNEADKFNPMIEKWLALEADPAKQQTIIEMRDAFGKEAPVTTPTDGGGGSRN